MKRRRGDRHPLLCAFSPRRLLLTHQSSNLRARNALTDRAGCGKIVPHVSPPHGHIRVLLRHRPRCGGHPAGPLASLPLPGRSQPCHSCSRGRCLPILRAHDRSWMVRVESARSPRSSRRRHLLQPLCAHLSRTGRPTAAKDAWKPHHATSRAPDSCRFPATRPAHPLRAAMDRRAHHANLGRQRRALCTQFLSPR